MAKPAVRMHRPPEGVVSPRTVPERLVFTTVGVLFMASFMALFNKALNIGGMQWDVFAQWPFAFATRAPLAWILQFFFVQKFAGKRVARYETHNAIEYYAIRAGFTVMIMCPVMSFYSLIVYVGFTSDFPMIWLTKMVQNWMFAFCVQLFLAGPLTRAVFSLIMRRGSRGDVADVHTSRADGFRP